MSSRVCPSVDLSDFLIAAAPDVVLGGNLLLCKVDSSKYVFTNFNEEESRDNT